MTIYTNNMKLSFFSLWLCLFIAQPSYGSDYPLDLFFGTPFLAMLVLNLPKMKIDRNIFFLAFFFSMLLLYKFAVNPTMSLKFFLELPVLVYIFSSKLLDDYENLEFLCKVLGIFFVVSFFMFLGCNFFEPLRVCRELFYSLEDQVRVEELMTAGKMSSALSYRGLGFSPNLYTFGYQLTLGLLVCFSFYLTAKKKERVFWTIGVMGGLSAVLLSGERTALFLVVIMAMLIGFSLKHSRRMLALGFSLLLLSSFFYVYSDSISDVRSFNTFSRLTEHENTGNRIYLQYWALLETFKAPFGLHGADADYDEMFRNDRLGPTVYKPHNGYLTEILFYGWGMVAFMLCLLVKTVHLLRDKRNLPVTDSPWLKLESASFLWLVAIALYPLLHNPSIFDFNPESVLSLMLYFKINGKAKSAGASNYAFC